MVVRVPELPPQPLLPFTRADLRGLLLRRHELDALLLAGLVVQPVRGVYLDARASDDLRHRALAVGLLLPDGAAVARRPAAWLHGVDARGPGELTTPLPMECVVPAGSVVPRRGGLVAHEARVPDGDVVEVAGVPVTSPVRTACDLARFLLPHMGLGCLDAMARAGTVNPVELAERIEYWRGERFVAQARRLIGLCDGESESFGESWTRLRIADAGFPRPELQVWVHDDDGVAVYRLDLGWPELRKAVEYDGEEHHSTLEDRRRDDLRRDDLLRRFGWDVVAVGKAEVLGPSMALERAVGEMLSLEPGLRRRLW